jgi:hypothetical protein
MSLVTATFHMTAKNMDVTRINLLHNIWCNIQKNDHMMAPIQVLDSLYPEMKVIFRIRISFEVGHGSKTLEIEALNVESCYKIFMIFYTLTFWETAFCWPPWGTMYS